MNTEPAPWGSWDNKGELASSDLEQLLAGFPDTVKTVYVGRDDCCRCGCRGDYSDADSEDPKEARRAKNRLVRMMRELAAGRTGTIFRGTNQWIFEIKTGFDRVACLYTAEETTKEEWNEMFKDQPERQVR